MASGRSSRRCHRRRFWDRSSFRGRKLTYVPYSRKVQTKLASKRRLGSISRSVCIAKCNDLIFIERVVYPKLKEMANPQGVMSRLTAESQFQVFVESARLTFQLLMMIES